MLLQRYPSCVNTICAILLLFIPTSEGVKRKIPKWVHKCSRSASNDKLLQCINKNFKIFQPRLASGIPEFHIPPLDPLYLDQVVLDIANFHVQYSNVTVEGATEFSMMNLDFDIQNYNVSLDVLFPSLHLEGFYEMKGHILFDLDNKGRTSANYANLLVNAKMQGEPLTKDGNTYLEFSDRKLNKITLDIRGNPMIYFSDLFPNNEELTRNMNRIINENIRELHKEFLPVMEEVISSFAINSVEEIFKSFSLEELFLP